MTQTVYYAKLDQDGIVERVQVTTRTFIDANPDRYPGTWVETSDPYADTPGEVTYCGPGYGHDDRFPERFGPRWVQPEATNDGWTSYPEGAVVWHNGNLWRSTTPNNVWEPGVSAWHDQPTGGQPPTWIQPTGAHDAYLADVKVTHDGTVWVNVHGDGNVWIPGVFGWEPVDA